MGSQATIDKKVERDYMNLPSGQPINFDNGVGWVHMRSDTYCEVTTKPAKDENVEDGNLALLFASVRGTKLKFEVSVQRGPDGNWRVFRFENGSEMSPKVWRADDVNFMPSQATTLQTKTVVDAILKAMPKFYEEHELLFAESELVQKNNSVWREASEVEKRRNELAEAESALALVEAKESQAKARYAALKAVREGR
jgi:hypothetical protein